MLSSGSVEPLRCICCCLGGLVYTCVYCMLCTLYNIGNIVSAHNDFLLIGDRSRQARQGAQTITTGCFVKVFVIVLSKSACACAGMSCNACMTPEATDFVFGSW